MDGVLGGNLSDFFGEKMVVLTKCDSIAIYFHLQKRNQVMNKDTFTNFRS